MVNIRCVVRSVVGEVMGPSRIKDSMNGDIPDGDIPDVAAMTNDEYNRYHKRLCQSIIDEIKDFRSVIQELIRDLDSKKKARKARTVKNPKKKS